MKHGMSIAWLATLSVAALPAAWADDDKFSLATGFDYSTGKYGTASTTDILSIPVIGKYATGSWVFKLTVPFIRISGTGEVVPGMGSIRARGTTNKVQSGLGDIVAATSYNLYQDSASTLGIDLTGKIKFATADAGLGSGANDYAAQMDAYKRLDKFTAMGSLGIKVLGSPAGTTLDPVLYGSLGGVFQFTHQTRGGLDMSIVQPPSTTIAGQQELTAYAIYQIDEHLKAQGYVLKGFADGSPDVGVGALVSYGF